VPAVRRLKAEDAQECAKQKGRPLGRTASDPAESTRSADVRDPFLSLRLGGGSWLSGKLKQEAYRRLASKSSCSLLRGIAPAPVELRKEALLTLSR
jgi:hypothetical protein